MGTGGGETFSTGFSTGFGGSTRLGGSMIFGGTTGTDFAQHTKHRRAHRGVWTTLRITYQNKLGGPFRAAEGRDVVVGFVQQGREELRKRLVAGIGIDRQRRKRIVEGVGQISGPLGESAVGKEIMREAFIQLGKGEIGVWFQVSPFALLFEQRIDGEAADGKDRELVAGEHVGIFPDIVVDVSKAVLGKAAEYQCARGGSHEGSGQIE
ncbi:MAG: hypothetical protein EBT61_18415 [Verrucomicrobia bacterium]|nr:hypothetical protein [Verrucomicrobiota bacterium]